MSMKAFEMMTAQRRARFVRGRRWMATAVTAPLAVALFAWQSMLPSGPLGWSTAAGLVTAAWLVAYTGGRLGSTLLPGLASGAIPLAAVLWSQGGMGDCQMDACTQACMNACAIGGVGGALMLVWPGWKRNWRPAEWFLSGWISVMVATLGCSCVGLWGTAAVAVSTASVLGSVQLVRLSRGMVGV
jgi:hypothetical protein